MKDAILRKARESADLKLRFFEENAASLETHTLLLHLLWDQVHVAMGEEDVL